MKNLTQLKLQIIPIIACFILMVGCGSTPPDTCNASSAIFNPLYANHPGTGYFGATGSGGYERTSYQYSFKSSVAGKICLIGSQGESISGSAQRYRFDVFDNTNAIIYSSIQQLNPSSVDYFTPSSAINIMANQVYTIRRTCVDASGSPKRNTILFKQIRAPFAPLVEGFMTITETQATDPSLPTDINVVLPFIDIVMN